MSVKQKIPYNYGVYFITFTCYQWLPLIELTQSYDLVYKWFINLTNVGHYIIGYQIMPNHVHAIIAFRNNSGNNINLVVRTGKRFMAYGMVERLIKNNEQQIFSRLQEGVNRSERKRGKNHEVWEKSFDWKECNGNKILLQKLNYMHDNPCSGKWQLVSSPVEFYHSSAKYYITGEQGIFKVTNYMELEDISLTNG